MGTSSWGLIGAAVLLVGCGGAADGVDETTFGLNGGSGPEVGGSDFGVSGPLRDLPSSTTPAPEDHREHPLRPLPAIPSSAAQDPVVQSAASPAVATTAGLNFAGVGNGDYGFAPNAAPPDTNGAVGATQYVQWVNESLAVFDKATGALVKAPTAGNALFQALGATHPCAVNNDGDPIAQYDKLAGRWVLTQFSVTNGSSVGFWQCIAVSRTSDATGSYNVYAFQQPNFNDYPKLGVWPDAYYVTFNMFTNTFQGARACAFDRAAMLAGNPATQVCFQKSNSVASLLPSDVDGTTVPPAGSPNYLLNFGTNVLNLFKFHVDFTTPASSTLTGPTTLAVAAFSQACGGGTCIPQPGTNNKLDSLADRLMYRLAYRRFADHEAMVVNHSVMVSGNRHSQVDGVRWYELRGSGGNWSVFQQATYSPDATSRWMGSIAMDKTGDIAVGYSKSSGTVFPSIAVTGRTSTDPAGTLQAENVVVAGAGSQTGSLHRWGDYSAMSVDPVDDCSFFYTTEYLKTSGSFNWSTRIVSFKFPGCN